MDRSNHKVIENEIDLREIFKTISQYKWSIISVIFSTLIMAYYILYFKVPMYVSNAIIEVKSSGAQSTQGQDDFIGSAFTDSGKETVDKEIEILETFNINNHALNKLDFQTQYFIDDRFKKVEIYHNIPLSIKDLTILDPNILWKMIKISPIEDGYTLEVQNSLKKKIKHLLFDKQLIELDTERIYPYDKKINTKYFELTVEKKNDLKQPLYISLKGSNRLIYEYIIRPNLEVFQINPIAPLIQVTYKDNIPKRADVYINNLLESFIEQSVAEKSKKINRILDFINKQLNDIKRKLDNSEDKLEKYRIANQAIDPTLQATTYIQELSNIEIELSGNRLKEKLIQNLIQFTEKGKDLDAIAPSLMELNDQPTLELITRLQEAQIKEEGLQAEYSGKHPGLIAVRKQIHHINKKIILNIQNLKSSMSHRNTNLKKLKKAYETKLESLPTQERTLINLKRDYEVSSQTYNYLLKKKSENEMTKVTILSDYRIIESAYSNGMPISPKPFFIMIVALILGIILGIMQALFRNFLNDKIQTKNDIESLTTLPIYGVLPVLKQKVIRLDVFKNPKSHFAESYRSLRTNLQFVRKENQANIILVTSTISGEGKSTTVANLGAIFQMANFKSIVINLDLRKPTLHDYFEVKNSAGISTYLSGKNRIGDIIQSTAYKNLDIISSGPIPPNPSELILSDKLDELLDTLKEVYDYIIIDSAPLGLVTDTMHLMPYADISLIVFRENYSQKSFVSDLNNLVKSHDLKHIGIVINSVDISNGSYGYGYGYGYGYKEDEKKKKHLG